MCDLDALATIEAALSRPLPLPTLAGEAEQMAEALDSVALELLEEEAA